MSNNKVLYVCEHCGNLVETIHNAGVPLVCCGQKMKKVEAGTVEASHEKHVPVATVEGDLVRVAVGSVEWETAGMPRKTSSFSSRRQKRSSLQIMAATRDSVMLGLPSPGGWRPARHKKRLA